MYMKRIFFVVLAAWLVNIGGMAQNTGITSEQMVSALNKNNKVLKLFPLANKLLDCSSFDDVAMELIKFDNGFKIEPFDGGELSAVSNICELQAVNCNDRPERIDTLTLFIKASIKKESLAESLEEANYTFKKHSSTFDWWQRADGTNLAIYYNYSDDFKTAMLFARPKLDEPETPSGSPEQPTEVTEQPAEGPAVTTEMQLNYFKRERTTHQNNSQLTVTIGFLEATGAIGAKLNETALESPLLNSLVSKKPKIEAGMSMAEIIDAYTNRVSDEFWADYYANSGSDAEYEFNYIVKYINPEKLQEGVVTYLNSVSTKKSGNEMDDYRIAANFDLMTGELLTFDKVFKKGAKKALYNKLRDYYINDNEQLEISNEKELKRIVEDALQNFILYRDQITFIMVLRDVNGLTEKTCNFRREDLQEYLR